MDLVAAVVRRASGVCLDDLATRANMLELDAHGRPVAYQLPQCLGELAHISGIGAFRFPSAPAVAGINVVLFTDHTTGKGCVMHMSSSELEGRRRR